MVNSLIGWEKWQSYENFQLWVPVLEETKCMFSVNEQHLLKEKIAWEGKCQKKRNKILFGG